MKIMKHPSKFNISLIFYLGEFPPQLFCTYFLQQSALALSNV